jgi:hypothetical protein
MMRVNVSLNENKTGGSDGLVVSMVWQDNELV